jgi:tRNA modification GTPase
VIPIGNKTDLVPQPQRSSILSDTSITYISSLEKHGLDALKDKLREFIQTSKSSNDIVVSNMRHFEALQQASDALEKVLQAIDLQMSGELLAMDIRKAIFHLGEITGEITTDDLLGNIFSKFCIGK